MSVRSDNPGQTAGVALAAVAGCVALTAAVMAAMLHGWVLPRPLDVAPAADINDDRADALAAADPTRARALSLATLRLQPVDGRAWLRLASLAPAPGGRLSPQALGWLERSYTVAPYDSQVLIRRTVFAYSHWSELPEELKTQTRLHVKAAWRLHYQRDQMLDAVKMVKSPPGKLALALDLFLFRVQANAEAAASAAARAADEGVAQN